MLTKLFSLLLIFLPFVVWKGFYEGPKIFLFLILGFLLTTFWIYKSLVKKQSFILDRSDIFYLLWLLVMIVSSIFGVHPLESIIGGSYRHQGVLFFFTLWLVYKTVQLFNKQDKIFLGKGIGLAVLGQALIFFIKPLGTIGEINAVAGFLVIGSYFVLEYLSKIYLVIPIIAIFITKSRAGMLALLPILFLQKQKILMVLIVILTIVISYQHISSPFEDRFLIWKLGVQSVIQKPTLGYGAESGEIVFDKVFKARKINLENLAIDRAHNLFLDVAMWSGVIGLIFFVGYLIERYKSLEDRYKKFAFLSFLIYSMFQPLSIVHWLLVFLL